MTVLARFSRVFQLLVVVYAVIAVLYTTNYLLVSPLHACLSNLLQPSSLRQPSWSLLSPFSGYSRQGNSWSASPQQTKNIIYWNLSDTSVANALASQDPVFPMQEDLFLSKAFANSFRPSKLVPFFYRATGTFDQDDITITTLITSNRFQVFARLVERYQGAPGAFWTRFSHLYLGNRSHLSHHPCQEYHGANPRTPGLAARLIHVVTQNVPIRRRTPSHRLLRSPIQHLAQYSAFLRAHGLCHDARYRFLSLHGLSDCHSEQQTDYEQIAGRTRSFRCSGFSVREPRRRDQGGELSKRQEGAYAMRAEL